MIFSPAARFLTGPFPPGAFAARFLAAVILPPLLFLAIFDSPPLSLRLGALAWQGSRRYRSSESANARLRDPREALQLECGRFSLLGPQKPECALHPKRVLADHPREIDAIL